MQHIAVECPNPAMVEARTKCWIDCRKVLDHDSARGIAGSYARAMIETMEAGRTRDTHAIMLGRPLDYQVRRWDYRFGPQTIAQGDTFRKLACKILSITLLAIIGLWMCRGSERQQIQVKNENIQQILFDEGISQESRQEDHNVYQDTSNKQGFRNRPVAPGGMGASISRMIIGIEYAPDPPNQSNRQTNALTFRTQAPRRLR